MVALSLLLWPCSSRATLAAILKQSVLPRENMSQTGRVILIGCSLTLIVALSAMVAWVTFGLLQSSATGEIQGYKLQGSIAAFAFTFGVLTTAFYGMFKLLTADDVKELSQRKDAEFKDFAQKSNEQIQDYARRIEELQAKLLRGAPCPPLYVIDLDEKNRLVFSRPGKWKNRNGVLYAYVEPARQGDPFAANFTVVVTDLTDAVAAGLDLTQQAQLDGFYGAVLAKVASDTPASMTRQTGFPTAAVPDAMSKEYVTVDGLRGAKYINTYIVQTNPPLTLRQSGVIVYVPRTSSYYVFTFSDDESDYLTSSDVFNNVMASVRFL